MAGSKGLPLLQGVMLLDGCKEGVLKERERESERRQTSGTETDRKLFISNQGNRTQWIMFQWDVIIASVISSKTRLSLGWISKAQVLTSRWALFKDALTLLITCAISKVPVVSMLAAMIGMPLYVCLELRNVKVLCRSTFENQTHVINALAKMTYLYQTSFRSSVLQRTL